jgi:hypothetical protein
MDPFLFFWTSSLQASALLVVVGGYHGQCQSWSCRLSMTFFSSYHSILQNEKRSGNSTSSSTVPTARYSCTRPKEVRGGRSLVGRRKDVLARSRLPLFNSFLRCDSPRAYTVYLKISQSCIFLPGRRC